MFEKVIESKFVDDHGGQLEFEKHRTAAAELLGPEPICLGSATEGLVDAEGNGIGHKLTTRWKSRG